MPQQGKSSLDELLRQYTPGVVMGANQFTGSLTNRNPNQVPGFTDIFENFRANILREGARGRADLAESFGSQGARYGSDIMRSNRDLGLELAERLIGGAGTLRAQEASTAQALTSAATYGTDPAMQRLWAEFLRRTSPSPFFDTASNYAIGLGGGTGQPTNIVTPR